MKRLISLLAIILLSCISAFTVYAENNSIKNVYMPRNGTLEAENSSIKNVYMSRDGTLEATFTIDELIEAGELLIYQNDKTGYKASVIVEENTDYAYRIAFNFEDGDAFFGFKTDVDYNDGYTELVAVHSKAAKLPNRILTDSEYSSLPYGDFVYNEIGGYYITDIGYVTEIREVIQKGIKGQGVSLYIYGNGLIRISSTVLDTDTKGGYDARSFKEIIGSNSKIIILAFFIAAFGLKHFLLDNVSKNSAELLDKKKNSNHQNSPEN